MLASRRIGVGGQKESTAGVGKPIVDQSVVIAQCYYDFRHNLESTSANTRHSAPLPSVLRVHTTQTITQTFRGQAAKATLDRHGMYLDAYNRLATRSIVSAAAGVGNNRGGVQRDGEERIVRHTKNSVTTRRMEPIAITGENILTHALGSLFFSSWRAYRATVFESKGRADEEAFDMFTANHAAGSASPDPLVAELDARSKALESQSPLASDDVQTSEDTHLALPQGRNGSRKPFIPFKPPKGSEASDVQLREAAAQLSTLLRSLERSQQKVSTSTRRGEASRGSTSDSRDTDASDQESSSIQTMLHLIDACDIGAMTHAMMPHSTQVPCPKYVFTDLLNPAFLPTCDVEDFGDAAQHLNCGDDSFLPSFLKDLLLSDVSSQNGDLPDTFAQCSSPYAEIRILSDVVRRYQHEQSVSATRDGFAATDINVDQTASTLDKIRKLHEQQQDTSQTQKSATKSSPRSQDRSVSSIVSLQSDPARWYRILDEAVEAFVLEYQYSSDSAAGTNILTNGEHAASSPSHFTDPANEHHYVMQAKKAVLRSLCLSLITFFDTRSDGSEGILSSSTLSSGKRPLLPSRYKEDYTLFLSKPDGTLLPTWEEFCADCGLPTSAPDGISLPTAQEGDEEQQAGAALNSSDATEKSISPSAEAGDPLAKAYREAVYRFSALNDSRVVREYLVPQLHERILTPSSVLVQHPLAAQTQQFRQLSDMHPLQQLVTSAFSPTQTAADYIPLTFTVCFTPRHPLTTGLHVAASSVREMLKSPTALLTDRSSLFHVPDALVAHGGAARSIRKIGSSSGAAISQSIYRDVARIFGDLSRGTARLLLKAICVSTLHDSTAAVSAGGRKPPQSVVTSFIALRPLVSGIGLVLSRNAEGSTFSAEADEDEWIGDGAVLEDESAGTLAPLATVTSAKRIPPITDASSAALALQLLEHEDGHPNVRLRNSVGVLEDLMAKQRGAHLLAFFPPLQLPFKFLQAMLCAELFEINSFLLLSNALAFSQNAKTNLNARDDVRDDPYAVVWEKTADEGAPQTHDDASALTSLYTDSDMAGVEGYSSAKKSVLDARALLRYFTSTSTASSPPPVSKGGARGGAGVLPTVLIPERAQRAREATDAFVTNAIGLSQRTGRDPKKPSHAREGGQGGLGPCSERGIIICGYDLAVHSQLEQTKNINNAFSSSSPQTSAPYEGTPDDLIALAGTTSLSALWEDAGLSAYDLALYGGGRPGAVPVMPPHGVDGIYSGNAHSSASSTVVGRVVAANAPLSHTAGGGRHQDPYNSTFSRQPLAIAMLARQASRACQQLAPSFVEQNLHRQREQNASALAKSRAKTERREAGGNDLYVHKDATPDSRSMTRTTLGGRPTDVNLADAIMSEASSMKRPVTLEGRLTAGKRAFDHLLRVGRRRAEEEGIALEKATSHLAASAKASVIGRSFTGKVIAMRGPAASLNDGTQHRVTSPSSAHSIAQAVVNSGLAPSSLASTYGLDPSAGHSLFAGRNNITSAARSNATSSPSVKFGPSTMGFSTLGIDPRPRTVEERVAEQQAQLEKRMEVKSLSRALKTAHRTEGLAIDNTTEGSKTSFDILSDPNSTMSLYVMKKMRPELRRLNTEERQMLEERSLVTDLGRQCEGSRQTHLGGLAESAHARSRIRHVTAEVEDTKAIEASLMTRKKDSRQETRAHDAALRGDLQRLMVDTALNASHYVSEQRSSPIPSVSNVQSEHALGRMVPTVTNTHDNRTLGFEHLMSRDRAASYLA